MKMTEKYQNLVSTYRNSPERVRKAVFSMTFGDYTPPIHAFVILDDDGKQSERVAIEDMPLNDTEREILNLQENARNQWRRVIGVHTQLLPYGPKRKKRWYEKLRQEAEVVWDEGYALSCEMASGTSSPHNRVMMAKLNGDSLGTQDLEYVNQLIQGMSSKADVYESRVEKFLKKHPKGFELVMSNL